MGFQSTKTKIMEISNLIDSCIIYDTENITELHLKNTDKVRTLDLTNYSNLKKLICYDNIGCLITLPDSIESIFLQKNYNIFFRGTETKLKVACFEYYYNNHDDINQISLIPTESLEILSVRYWGTLEKTDLPFMNFLKRANKLKELYVSAFSYDLTDLVFPRSLKVICFTGHDEAIECCCDIEFKAGNVVWPTQLDILWINCDEYKLGDDIEYYKAERLIIQIYYFKKLDCFQNYNRFWDGIKNNKYKQELPKVKINNLSENKKINLFLVEKYNRLSIKILLNDDETSEYYGKKYSYITEEEKEEIDKSLSDYFSDRRKCDEDERLWYAILDMNENEMYYMKALRETKEGYPYLCPF